MIGRRDCFFFPARFASFHTRASRLTFFVCFFIIFNSCCNHAGVFGKTLVHEFTICYSHTECYLLFSLGKIVLALGGAPPIIIWSYSYYYYHTPITTIILLLLLSYYYYYYHTTITTIILLLLLSLLSLLSYYYDYHNTIASITSIILLLLLSY